MLMVQLKLTDGNKYIITWVEDRKGIKKGSRVTLKGLPNTFEVSEIFQHKDSSLIHTTWDNNFRGTLDKIFEEME